MLILMVIRHINDSDPDSAWPYITKGVYYTIDKETNICLFLLCCFMSQVNSYGHGGTVSSPYHTFSWASLNKQLTSTLCTYFRL